MIIFVKIEELFNKSPRFLSILLSISISFAVTANNSSDSLQNNLDEVIISATKSKRILSSLPLNASIIKKEEIQRTNATKLSDVINEQTGLLTVSDYGGGEGIQMQGLDSEYSLILIDNQPLIGRQAGTFDLDRISVGNIKQIEIVRGASSSLYGNEALAGVINILTEEPKKGFTGSLSNSIETNNSIDNNLTLNYANTKLKSSLFFNNFSSDGYDLSEDDDLRTVNKFKNNTIQLKLGYLLNEQFRIKLNSRYFTQTIENIGSNLLTGETYNEEANINLGIEHNSEKIRSDFEIYTTAYFADEFLNDQNDNVFSQSFYDHILIKPEAKSIFSLKDKDNIVVGLGLKYETLKRTYFDSQPKQNSPFIYFQYDFNIDKKTNLIFGWRYDSFKEYNSQLSPKISGIYKIDDNKSIKISAGYGFKAPDFRQLYFNFTNSTVGYSVIGYNVFESVINQLNDEGLISNLLIPVEDFYEPLKPESSFSLNIGYDFKINNKISLKTNVFNNTAKDLIDTRVVANKTNGQNVFSYYNLDKVMTGGVEIEGLFKYDNYLSFSFGYQLLYALDLEAIKAFNNGDVYARLTTTSPTFQLNRSDYFGLFNRSRHMGMFKISYFNEKYDLDTLLRIRFRSKYGLYDTNGNNYLDKYDEFVKGYFTTNLSLNKTINKLIISTGIENLFNYTDSQNITNLSGRLLYLKLILKLNNKSWNT